MLHRIEYIDARGVAYSVVRPLEFTPTVGDAISVAGVRLVVREVVEHEGEHLVVATLRCELDAGSA